MPVISRLLSVVLRVAELAFAAVVAGIIGHYLHEQATGYGDPWKGREIYTEVIAGISLLLGLIWLIPTAHTFFVWPLDVILALAWFAAFGLLVDAMNDASCGPVFDWGRLWNDDFCSHWKAAEAFSFLSAIIWLVSGLLGIYFVWRVDRSRFHRNGYVYGRYNV